jgi:hypothetical protein
MGQRIWLHPTQKEDLRTFSDALVSFQTRESTYFKVQTSSDNNILNINMNKTFYLQHSKNPQFVLF